MSRRHREEHEGREDREGNLVLFVVFASFVMGAVRSFSD